VEYCVSYKSASDRWGQRIGQGLTDSELREAISSEFGTEGSRSDSKGSVAYKGGENPTVSYKSGPDNPQKTVYELKGKLLISKTRELLLIPGPVAQKDIEILSDPKPEVESILARDTAGNEYALIKTPQPSNLSNLGYGLYHRGASTENQWVSISDGWAPTKEAYIARIVSGRPGTAFLLSDTMEQIDKSFISATLEFEQKTEEKAVVDAEKHTQNQAKENQDRDLLLKNEGLIAAELKTVHGKRQTISVQFANGMEEIKANQIGDFAYHKDTVKPGWVLTHVPSGFRISPSKTNRGAAKKADIKELAYRLSLAEHSFDGNGEPPALFLQGLKATLTEYDNRELISNKEVTADNPPLKESMEDLTSRKSAEYLEMYRSGYNQIISRAQENIVRIDPTISLVKSNEDITSVDKEIEEALKAFRKTSNLEKDLLGADEEVVFAAKNKHLRQIEWVSKRVALAAESSEINDMRKSKKRTSLSATLDDRLAAVNNLFPEFGMGYDPFHIQEKDHQKEVNQLCMDIRVAMNPGMSATYDIGNAVQRKFHDLQSKLFREKERIRQTVPVNSSVDIDSMISKVTVRPLIGDRPDNIPADWVIFNAPRPLIGTKTWEGDFNHGRFYAAINPKDEFADQNIVENNKLDGWVLEYFLEDQAIEWTIEQTFKYLQGKRTKEELRESASQEYVVNRFHDKFNGKKYEEVRDAFKEIRETTPGSIEIDNSSLYELSPEDKIVENQRVNAINFSDHLPSVESAWESTPQVMVDQWDACMTKIAGVQEIGGPTIERIEAALLTIKGQRKKEFVDQKDSLNRSIDNVNARSQGLISEYEALFQVLQSSLESRALAEAQKRGINFSEQDRVKFQEKFGLNISGLSPYIENYHDTPIKEIFKTTLNEIQPQAEERIKNLIGSLSFEDDLPTVAVAWEGTPTLMIHSWDDGWEAIENIKIDSQPIIAEIKADLLAIKGKRTTEFVEQRKDLKAQLAEIEALPSSLQAQFEVLFGELQTNLNNRALADAKERGINFSEEDADAFGDEFGNNISGIRPYIEVFHDTPVKEISKQTLGEFQKNINNEGQQEDTAAPSEPIDQIDDTKQHPWFELGQEVDKYYRLADITNTTCSSDPQREYVVRAAITLEIKEDNAYRALEVFNAADPLKDFPEYLLLDLPERCAYLPDFVAGPEKVYERGGGYDPGHPWYYKLGGAIIPFEEIGARQDEPITEESIKYLSGVKTKIKKDPAKIKGALDKKLSSLQETLKHDREQYERLLVLGDKAVSDYDLRMGYTKDTSLSLTVAHISYDNQQIKDIQRSKDWIDQYLSKESIQSLVPEKAKTDAIVPVNAIQTQVPVNAIPTQQPKETIVQEFLENIPVSEVSPVTEGLYDEYGEIDLKALLRCSEQEIPEDPEKLIEMLEIRERGLGMSLTRLTSSYEYQCANSEDPFSGSKNQWEIKMAMGRQEVMKEAIENIEEQECSCGPGM
jgi:hypothetical protein